MTGALFSCRASFAGPGDAMTDKVGDMVQSKKRQHPGRKRNHDFRDEGRRLPISILGDRLIHPRAMPAPAACPCKGGWPDPARGGGRESAY